VVLGDSCVCQLPLRFALLLFEHTKIFQDCTNESIKQGQSNKDKQTSLV
jgi:hypothetical protein